MNRILLLFSFSLFSLLRLSAQAPQINWQRCLGGSDGDFGQAVLLTSDDHYLVVSSTNSMDGDVDDKPAQTDIWILKLDANGNTLWQLVVGGLYPDFGIDATECSDGGFAILGRSYMDASGNDNDLRITRLSRDGALLWDKTYGGSYSDQGNAILETPDQGFLVAGVTHSSDGDIVSQHHGNADAWLLKLDAGGKIEWEHCYGGSDNDWANSIIACREGGYLFAGFTASDDGDLSPTNMDGNAFWAVKLNEQGSIEWQWRHSRSPYDHLNAVIQARDGSYVACGQTYHNAQGLWDSYLVKFNPAGQMVAEWSSETLYPDYFFDLCETAEGNIVACGIGSQDPHMIPFDASLYKFNLNDLSLQWVDFYGGNERDAAYSIALCPDSGFVLCGITKSNDGDVSGNHGDYDNWILKLDPEPLKIFGAPILCPGEENWYRQNRPYACDWYLDDLFQTYADSFRTSFVSAGTYRLKACYEVPGRVYCDSVLLEVKARPQLNLPESTAACAPLEMTVCPGALQPGLQFRWSNGSTDSCIVVKTPGWHTTTASSEYCSTTDSIRVVEYPLPDFRILQPDTLCMDDQHPLTLLAEPDSFPLYSWNGGLSIDTWMEVYTDDPVSLEVTNSQGCSREIRFKPLNGCPMTWYIPDAFSPNGDNLNDSFRVEGFGIASYEISVTDRWGEVLYTGKDGVWDGRFRGKPVPNGLYLVLIRLEPENPTLSKPQNLKMMLKVIR